MHIYHIQKHRVKRIDFSSSSEKVQNLNTGFRDPKPYEFKKLTDLLRETYSNF